MIWFNKTNCLYYRMDYKLKIVEHSRDKRVWLYSVYSYEEFITAVRDKSLFIVSPYNHESLENKQITLYINTQNLQYYRVRNGRVYVSRDTIVWRPSVFNVWDLSDNPSIFAVVEPPSVTLENK